MRTPDADLHRPVCSVLPAGSVPGQRPGRLSCQGLGALLVSQSRHRLRREEPGAWLPTILGRCEDRLCAAFACRHVGRIPVRPCASSASTCVPALVITRKLVDTAQARRYPSN